MVVPFLYELRKRRVPVGLQEAVQLAKALSLGLHQSSLDGFYYVARALCVHRESDLDRFDEAFLAHFRGIAGSSTRAIDDLLEEWLKNPKVLESLTDEQRALLEALDPEELRQLLEQRLREQKERHEGGNRWIGTGGTSPFGTGGHHPSGISMRAGSQGRGGRGAVGMADARRYRPYRSDVVLDLRQIEVALRKLRSFVREGALEELDVEGTIDRTARNGGELEIVVRPPRRSNVRVVLLMDVGGSMDPFAQTCSQLFSAARRASHFRELRTYYFHNTIYGRVYTTDALMEPIEVSRLLEQVDSRYKLVLVGDAAMAPGELLGSGPWGSAPGGPRSGFDWLAHLAERFERSVWLNPDPPQYWSGGTARAIRELFPMYPLTLDGLSEAMVHLSKTARASALPQPE
ncbi:MAG: VWA domain-containing protein [Polyangiaceae bacterium]|nr:VWA domain-containing protein [Polyangiaceae bacterium]